MKNWLSLFAAILVETMVTAALKVSDGFAKPWPLGKTTVH